MKDVRYRAQLALTNPGEKEYERQRTERLSGPLFSIVGLGEGGDLLPSVKAQTYAHLEYLDAYDDPYSAAMTANGAFLLFLPKDSVLTPDALYRFAMASRGADVVYADDDTLLHNGKRSSPHYKPDFAPQTLLSYPYIGFPFAIRRDLFRHIAEREMLADRGLVELSLFAALSADTVRHIPRVLLSQRTRLPLLDSAPIARTLRRLHRSAIASDGMFPGSFRVRYAYKPKTRVTVVIGNRYAYPVLKKTLETIEQASVFDAYDLLIANTRSDDAALERYLDGLEKNHAAKTLRLSPDTAPAAMWNRGAEAAENPYLLFLDAAFLPEGYHDMECLLEHCAQPGIGAVGGKLLDASGRLLSSGMLVGLHGGIGSLYRGSNSGRDRMQNLFTRMVRNVSVLPVCGMMAPRAAFFDAGAFDQTMPEAGFDQAFCLRLAERKLGVVYTPYAAFRQHAEPAEPQPMTQQDDVRMMDAFRNMLIEGDPYFNPNWDYGSDTVRLALPPRPAIDLHQKGVWFPLAEPQKP